jgi:DNA-directed RNA polymerase sigma subunit (sigma70/sigma32)
MDTEHQLAERRRPPSWVTKWKDPGIVLIVLGLCVTTGRQIERMDDMDKQATQISQINAQLSRTVTELATQMTSLSGQVANMPQVTRAATQLETRMDAADRQDKEFRDDLKAWMVRVENKIDRESQRDRQR